MAIDWSLAAVQDVIAAADPDREMLVWNSIRRTYGEVRERSRSLAAFLVGHGLGARRERAELERWESGQDAVAVVMANRAEYLETMLGCFRARTVPFNVNHHYTPGEVGGVFDMIGPRAVVYQRSLGPLVSGALDRMAVEGPPPLLVHVEDGSDAPLPAGSTSYADAVSTAVGDLPTPCPDDLYMVCTGGTTGRPKAVLWRQADIFVAGMAGSEDTTEDSIREALANRSTWFATPPMMHAAAQWTAFSGLNGGATVVLHEESQSFDAAHVLRLVEAERVSVMSIVGDAYARPLVEELRRNRYDLSSLTTMGTGGAATSGHLKEALLELVPHLMIVDGYGASETGGMAFGPQVRGMDSFALAPAAGATVLSEDRTRFLEPGDDEIGWTARTGRVPLGYLGDPDKTRDTFPVIGGIRVSVPGDRARFAPDGTITLLGRDSLVVNTGGEKVFVEEVEEVLRSHPDVVDALVVGRPSDRFGQEVVGVVQLRPGAAVDPNGLREFTAQHPARFKAPRAIALCEEIRRLANGKADYAWANRAALDAVEATASAA